MKQAKINAFRTELDRVVQRGNADKVTVAMLLQEIYDMDSRIEALEARECTCANTGVPKPEGDAPMPVQQPEVKPAETAATLAPVPEEVPAQQSKKTGMKKPEAPKK